MVVVLVVVVVAAAGAAEDSIPVADEGSAVVVRVISIAEGWVSLILAGRSCVLPLVDRPPLRE